MKTKNSDPDSRKNIKGKTFPHPATEITTFKGAKSVNKKADQIGLEFNK